MNAPIAVLLYQNGTAYIVYENGDPTHDVDLNEHCTIEFDIDGTILGVACNAVGPNDNEATITAWAEQQIDQYRASHP